MAGVEGRMLMREKLRQALGGKAEVTDDVSCSTEENYQGCVVI